MDFKVVPRFDLSLQDLAAFHRAGHSVTKSPHVGNWYPNNLAVASLGIPMSIYDRTIGTRDRNFHPHKVIVDGGSEEIANPAILTTHARVIGESSWFPDRFPMGSRVLDGHVQAIRDAVPGANCEVFTDYLRRHINRVLAILEVVTKRFPRLWRRFVDQNGIVSERACLSWSSVTYDGGVYGLTNDEFGWLIPNELNVLLDGVLEAAHHNESVVYHLSGPDMIGYIDGYAILLANAHQELRERLDWVPKTVELHVVPVAAMRFAVPETRRRALDALMDGLLAIYAWRTARGEQIPPGSNGNRRIAAMETVEEKTEHRRMKSRLRELAAECPEVWYDITKGSFVSQYDLLASGTRIYVHPWAAAAPIALLQYTEQYAASLLQQRNSRSGAVEAAK
ncbi:MAG: hypothetical protein HY437_00700 [Candidatus Magasanikbacteria bacterium]|nr:hypothetical protein [Candidatus Magasanikbacteria bacterium]